LPDLLQVMVQSLCDAVEAAEFCCIVLNNPQCDRLILTVTTGIGTEKLRLDDALSNREGWLSQAVRTTKERISQGSDFGVAPQPPITNDSLPASVCAVRIQSPEGGRLGILAIGNWEDRDAFDEEDRNLLVAVGEQAAIAINNARLIKTLEEREDRLANQNETLASQNQELEHQRQQIQLQNLQLMEAARLKSQFLATMSHELRTPMNAIIGFSQLLLHSSKRSRSVSSGESHSLPSGESRHQFKAQPLTAEQENMVQRILDNGKHLLSLIDDILDLSKIESGRLELEPEQLNLANLVQATVEELRSLAEEKQLDLQVDARLSNPLIINDSVRLRQILMNLLSNAIKFTERGVVQIEVWEYSPNCISLTVKDTGIGIAQENLEHIFEAFRQVDQSLSKKHYGTGLGLAITKSLIQMMNGSITVHSMLGEGSIFRVDIPRDIPVSAAQRETGITRKTLR
jgi:two-component system, NarL family, sensor histidine kinase BarA